MQLDECIRLRPPPPPAYHVNCPRERMETRPTPPWRSSASTETRSSSQCPRKAGPLSWQSRRRAAPTTRSTRWPRKCKVILTITSERETKNKSSASETPICACHAKTNASRCSRGHAYNPASTPAKQVRPTFTHLWAGPSATRCNP